MPAAIGPDIKLWHAVRLVKNIFIYVKLTEFIVSKYPHVYFI